MPYIDAAYLRNAFGTDQVDALCATTDELTTTIELAEAETESALLVGGYTGATPSSVYATVAACPKQIKLAAYGAWLELAHGRNLKSLPEALRVLPGHLEDLRQGRLQIEGVDKAGAAVVGGSSFTESSSSVTAANGGRAAVFDRETLEGF